MSDLCRHLYSSGSQRLKETLEEPGHTDLFVFPVLCSMLFVVLSAVFRACAVMCLSAYIDRMS
jgi:hypothetical protein